MRVPVAAFLSHGRQTMVREIPKAVAIGVSRFGLGARPGDLAAVGGDARDALAAEVSQSAVANPGGENILPSPEVFHRFRDARKAIKELRLADREKAADALGAGKMRNMEGGPGTVSAPGDRHGALDTRLDEAKAAFRGQVRARFQAETLGRVAAGTGARIGFAERLVLFWSNHFCVSARKGPIVRVLAGPFEREAIRPHVFGKFADMLLAAEKHPAMLAYLDNEQSVGPHSRAGERMGKGLNENLAREMMELHTLGVAGGYTQEDVTSLSRILTGWRFAQQDTPFGEAGKFIFNPGLHEPGDHKLLGVAYRQEGAGQGEAAILGLAHHPATARHIALKLAAHFVADDPPPALVTRLETTFRDTEGDLAAVSRALIDAPESWAEARTKLRLPYEFLIASLRATGVTLMAPQINGALAGMGQPLWSPPAPNGFSDSTAAWASPEGMKARLDYAARLAAFVPAETRPATLLEEVAGPLASPETREAVARAESPAQGVALVLMSPEFQRR